MTLALFLSDDLPDPLPPLGSRFTLDGPEGRHAAAVRRIAVGELVLISSGRGSGVQARVVETGPSALVVTVEAHRHAPARPRRHVAVQALAKGDRSELAIEMLTELGVDEIVPWSAGRSIVRWSGDRAGKSLTRWRSTVREATKQSRRLIVPLVSEPVSTRQLVARIEAAELTLVLHEEATTSLAAVELPASGTVVIVIGPEGGISSEELEAFVAAGAQAVSISDGVLRTSTAGVVALAGLLLR